MLAQKGDKGVTRILRAKYYCQSYSVQVDYMHQLTHGLTFVPTRQLYRTQKTQISVLNNLIHA